MPVVLGVNNTVLKVVRDSEVWSKLMVSYQRGDFLPPSNLSANVDVSDTHGQSSKSGGRKRKAQDRDASMLFDDSDSSDSDVVSAKRPRLRLPSPTQSKSDSSDDSSSSESDSSPAPPVKKTKPLKSKGPSQDHSAAASALAQILGALPPDFLQSVLPQDVNRGPVAGPSRLPHGSGGSGSGSKSKKSGHKRSR